MNGQPAARPVRQIRTARPGDAAGIARVHVRAWQVAYQGLLRRAVIRAHARNRRQWWISYLDQAHAREHVLVATAGDRIVAFATARPSPDEDAERDQAEVSGLYVSPEAWGQGIGADLLEGVLEKLRRDGFTTATLWVLAGNDRARGFYENRGWSRDGAERVHPERGAVELRYRTTLSAT